ncbi:MAG: DUF3179 domain-containing protein [Thermodesulfovibrionia bacterium]|nr:DUF3179 domain-containing protein [Thermodesulfovibrionia bacterium]
MSFSIRILTFFVLVFFLPLSALSWDFSRHSIPLDDIVSGGPPRDGIPALITPKFVQAKNADFVNEDEQVLGVYLNGIARAFPTRILSWHELVNDRYGDLPVLVSW